MPRSVSGIQLSVIDLGRNDDGMSWAGGVFGGHTLMLCSEGVCYDVTEYDDERMQREWGVESADILTARVLLGDEGFIAPEELVRVFGSRLENNLSLFLCRAHELMDEVK